MSMPNIDNINPEISLTIEEVINLLLASIALEEIGLAHIINAEGEKLQAALGTLTEGGTPLVTNIDDLVTINDSVEQTLKTIIKKEMLLQFKLENTMDLMDKQ